MSYLQLSFTHPVPEKWQGTSDDEWNSNLAEIFAVVEKHGGSAKVTGFSPSQLATVSVIEYPDSASAMRAVAGVIALGSIQFDSIHQLWDLAEWRTLIVEGTASS